MKPKAIFIDIDNTLVPHGTGDLIVSKENIKALKDAQKKGIYIVISTGRSLLDAEPVYKQIKHNEYSRFIISNNSAAVDEEIKGKFINIFDNEINVNTAKKMIEFAKSKELIVKLSQDNNLYGVTKSYFLKIWFKYKKNKPLPYSKIDVEKIGSRRKLGFIPQEFSLSYIETILDEMKLKFPSLEIVTSGNGRFVEVTNKGISKATGIKLITKQLNIKLKDCAAFGDSGNDVEMFKIVGIPVVMKQAKEHIKIHAKLEADTSRNNGVSKMIQSLIKD